MGPSSARDHFFRCWFSLELVLFPLRLPPFLVQLPRNFPSPRLHSLLPFCRRLVHPGSYRLAPPLSNSTWPILADPRVRTADRIHRIHQASPRSRFRPLSGEARSPHARAASAATAAPVRGTLGAGALTMSRALPSTSLMASATGGTPAAVRATARTTVTW